MTNFHLYEKVAIDSENVVTFVDQFVNTVHDFSSQYGNSNSISYIAQNITGPPSKFPDYGDFPHAYVMRTYGRWWDKAPSRSIDYMPQNNPDVISHDYIDLEYPEPVYPIRISIYEIYNPGSVVRIWAQDSKHQWFQLWNGPPQTVPLRSRIFSPPLQLCNFKTKMIRLEFNHNYLDYYTELDAVSLIGTFELILPKDQSSDRNLSKLLQSMNDAYPDEKDIHNLTPNYLYAKKDLYRFKESLQEHCIMCKFDVENFRKSKLISKLQPLYHDASSFKERCNNMQLFLQKDFLEFTKIQISNILEDSPNNSFSMLPNETTLKILEYLDLKSLYRICNVNKYFNTLARDFTLYKCLNLRPYWYSFDTNALSSLISRCKCLQQLDLSWCGNHNMLTSASLIDFLKECGGTLTHLRLNCCKIVDDSVTLQISSTCKELKELCLRNCQNIKKSGFLHLQNLHFLEILDLYRTFIETVDVCRILQRNPRMRHLNVGGVLERLNADDIAKELGNSCPDLESVDFWKAVTLTSQGINALTRCKNLREVDFSWCGTINQNESIYELFICCKHLEKIFLSSFRGLAERDLKHLVSCKELKQLDLLGSMSLTQDICQDILLCCPKLEMIDLSFCDLISNSKIDEWRREFPNVSIKKSFLMQQT